MQSGCISGAHILWRIPEFLNGDVKILAGDGLGTDTLDSMKAINDGFRASLFRRKIVLDRCYDWLF